MTTDYTLQTRLRFDLSGNVGIGTTKPQSKLDVRGAVSATSLSGTLNWTDVSGAPPYELPPGSILVYDASMNIDSSFILADGSTVNRADYPELADVLGIPFDQLTFQLPNPALQNQVDWDVSNNNIQTYIKNKPNIYKDLSNNVVSGSHLIPSTNVSYDLGTPDYRWKDLYLSGNTIDLGGTKISKDVSSGGIKLEDNVGNPLDAKFGNIIPATNLTFDLGSPESRWNDLYLSGNSIDLSGTILSRHTDGSFMVHDASNNMVTGRFNDMTAEGNVGVGTDNPSYKLHVIGDTRIQGNLTIDGTQTMINTDIQVTDMIEVINDGTGPALRVTQTGVEVIADFCDDTSDNVVVRIADGGNVGIGTLTPKCKLHVMGDVSANNFFGKLKWTDVSGAPPYELAPGSVIVYDGSMPIDDSFIPVTGQTLNRSDYPELANALGIPNNQPTFTMPSPSEYQPNWNDSNVNSSTYIRNKPNIFGDISGNVGIGTSTMNAILHVSGNTGNSLLNVEQNVINQEYPPSNISSFTPDYTDTITSIDSVLYGLFEYPPLPNPLTGPNTTISGAMYGNGSYVVSASSTNSTYSPYLAFDKNPYLTSQWQSASSTYNTTAPYSAVAGVTTIVSGTTYTGSWIQIQLPSSIVVKQYSLTHFYVGSGEALPPSEWLLAGSSDGSAWSLLHFSNIQVNNDSIYTFDISGNTNSFTYYRIIITKIIGNNNRAALNEIRLYAPTSATVPTGGLEFPPVPLYGFSYDVRSTYGAGTYNVLYSSVWDSTTNYLAWKAFNKQLVNDLQVWYPMNNVYSSSNGSYTGVEKTTLNNNTTVLGEWLQIQLSVPIMLKSYQIAITNTGWTPKQWYIVGSLDGMNWYLVDNQTQSTTQTGWTANTFRSYTVSSSLFYNYYRIIINASNNSTSIHIGEWKLFGDIISRYPKYKTYQSSSISNYGSGLYTIFSNTLLGITTIDESNPTKLINKSLSEWSTGSSTYTSTADAFPTPIVHLYLPTSIIVRSYTIRGSSDTSKSPSKWSLYGYNGTSWILIDSESGITWTSNEVKVFDVSNNSNFYSNYYIEVLRNNSVGDNNIAISEFYFNGNDAESKIFIDNNGRVGINTSVLDTNILNINGNSKLTGDLTITNNTIVNGNLGIGTNSPLAKLHVNGIFYCSGMTIQTVYKDNALTVSTQSQLGNTSGMTDLDIGINIIITPKFATSKIKITWSGSMTYVSSGHIKIMLYKNGASLVGNPAENTYWIYTTSSYLPTYATYIDVPNTISPITYGIRGGGNGLVVHGRSYYYFAAEEIAA